MNQVVVGMFASYRDGHDALRALQLAGLKRDDAQLYRARRTAGNLNAFPLPPHEEDDAEYAAHGEHQGVSGACNRFMPSQSLPRGVTSFTGDDSMNERTLLVIRITEEIKPGAISDVLHEHGALAVKDAAGRWRFSPYRTSLHA
jgi:hypothetical protein